MFKTSPPNSIIQWAAFATIFAILTACGGGGGGNPPPNVPSPTPQPDTTPDGLSFEAKENVGLNVWVESDPVVIAGINREVAISISDGEYAIGEDDFTDEAGTITAGQTVRVRVMSAATLDTASQATLTVGEGEAIFTATTFADTQAPVAEIAFPPPVSMTANTTLTVRGTVTDDYSEVTEMTVLINGFDSEASVKLVADEDNPGVYTWNAEIALFEDMDNTIIVAPMDSAGNVDSETASVKVTQGSLDNQFPDAENSIGRVRTVALDTRNGQRRLITVSSEEGQLPSIITTINLDTSEVLDRVTIEGIPVGYESAVAATLDELTNYLYLSTIGSEGYAMAKINVETGAADSNKIFFEREPNAYPGRVIIDRSAAALRTLVTIPRDQAIYEADLELGAHIVFSGPDMPDNEIPLVEPSDIIFCECDGENQFYVVDGPEATIITVDPITGAREVFSLEGTNGTTEFFSSNPKRSLAMDSIGNRLLIAGATTNQIIEVSLEDGQRDTMSNDPVMGFRGFTDLIVHSSLGYALAVEGLSLNAVFAVDLQSGERVVVAKGRETNVSD